MIALKEGRASFADFLALFRLGELLPPSPG